MGNGKLIANCRESRKSATKIRSWIVRQLNAAHLKEADILSDADIKSIVQIKKEWKANPNDRKKKKTSNYLFSFGGFPSFGDIYYAMLGDLSPTVPFLIYLFGTLSGILIGVCAILCA